MENHLATLNRLIREHEETLESIQECSVCTDNLASLCQRWIPGHPEELEHELAHLEGALSRLNAAFEKHMLVEEREFLPTLTKHATDIVSKGLMYKHREILQSINLLRANARDSVKKSSDREQLIIGESRINEAIRYIQQLVEDHVHVQEVIFSLAREVLAEESEYTSGQ